MIQHTVTLTWNDSVPSGHAQDCVDALIAMSRTIGTIREYRCGADLGLAGQGDSRFVIVATFDDVDGWRHYDEHPLHNEIRASFSGHMLRHVSRRNSNSKLRQCEN